MGEFDGPAGVGPGRGRPGTHTRVGEAAELVLDALDDEDCRRILGATATEPLSAQELADRLDLPRSTAYRKLERLTEAGLVRERTRVRPSGHHTSEYARVVEDVDVHVGPDGGVEVAVDRGTRPQVGAD
jgi:DNA-binding transcriptional ArsR family regulator